MWKPASRSSCYRRRASALLIAFSATTLAEPHALGGDHVVPERGSATPMAAASRPARAAETGHERADFPAALVAHAMLSVQRLDYPEAMTNLDRALVSEPRHAQGLLLRALVHLAQGRPRPAARDCAALPVRVAERTRLACRAAALSVLGRAQDALEILSRAVLVTKDADIRTLLWVQSLRAEAHHLLGHDEVARAMFASALGSMRTAGVTDLHVVETYADVLLDSTLAVEAAALLESFPATDELLLRRAEAATAFGDGRALDYRRQLDGRLDAGQNVSVASLRNRARFALRVKGDAAEALSHALRNWEVRRERIDARLVLEAALAADRPEAVTPVLTWMDETSIEDTRLRKLRSRLLRQ